MTTINREVVSYAQIMNNLSGVIDGIPNRTYHYRVNPPKELNLSVGAPMSGKSVHTQAVESTIDMYTSGVVKDLRLQNEGLTHRCTYLSNLVSKTTDQLSVANYTIASLKMEVERLKHILNIEEIASSRLAADGRNLTPDL